MSSVNNIKKSVQMRVTQRGSHQFRSSPSSSDGDRPKRKHHSRHDQERDGDSQSPMREAQGHSSSPQSTRQQSDHAAKYSALSQVIDHVSPNFENVSSDKTTDEVHVVMGLIYMQTYAASLQFRDLEARERWARNGNEIMKIFRAKAQKFPRTVEMVVKQAIEWIYHDPGNTAIGIASHLKGMEESRRDECVAMSIAGIFGFFRFTEQVSFGGTVAVRMMEVSEPEIWGHFFRWYLAGSVEFIQGFWMKFYDGLPVRHRPTVGHMYKAMLEALEQTMMFLSPAVVNACKEAMKKSVVVFVKCFFMEFLRETFGCFQRSMRISVEEITCLFENVKGLVGMKEFENIARLFDASACDLDTRSLKLGDHRVALSRSGVAVVMSIYPQPSPSNLDELIDGELWIVSLAIGSGLVSRIPRLFPQNDVSRANKNSVDLTVLQAAVGLLPSVVDPLYLMKSSGGDFSAKYMRHFMTLEKDTMIKERCDDLLRRQNEWGDYFARCFQIDELDDMLGMLQRYREYGEVDLVVSIAQPESAQFADSDDLEGCVVAFDKAVKEKVVGSLEKQLLDEHTVALSSLRYLLEGLCEQSPVRRVYTIHKLLTIIQNLVDGDDLFVILTEMIGSFSRMRFLEVVIDGSTFLQSPAASWVSSRVKESWSIIHQFAEMFVDMRYVLSISRPR